MLTKEIAERFVVDPSSVKLSEFTSIENAAAAVLKTFRGGLALDGVTIISASVAIQLREAQCSAAEP